MKTSTGSHNSETRSFRPTQGTRLVTVPARAPLRKRVEALEDEATKLSLLLEMSRTLSAVRDLDGAMEQIISYTTRIMSCERSSVFLLDSKKNELYALAAQGLDVHELRFSASSGIAGYVAAHGVGLNVPDAYQDERFNPEIDRASGFHTVSLLCMPLLNRHGEPLGVLQCLNKTGTDAGPSVFTQYDELVLSAVAAQAAVYLDNSLLRHQMDVLFESFVEATSRAIDERDPCTSGHSRRVMLYALNLARAVHDADGGVFADVRYTRERIRQLRYASLLHDVGKIGVREHILCKAARLAPPALEAVRQRLRALREESRANMLSESVSTSVEAYTAAQQRHSARSAELSEAQALIDRISGNSFLPDTELAQLRALQVKGLITSEEFLHLSIRRGNLTENEWVDMRSHVEKTFRILKRIPWPNELHDLADIAYSHHEKRDGSGYPRQLKGDDIHFDSQVLCVADIYDALTAGDRPYKKATPHELAQQILMEEEAARGKIIPALVQLFFDAECYNISELGVRAALQM